MPAGGIADDVVKFALFQFVHDASDAFDTQRVLVTRLGRWQDVEVVNALVLDQGLMQAGLLIDQIHKIVHDAPFATHDQVKITQADVKIDNHRLVAAFCQARSNGGAGGCLADPTFT